jgi:uncharacterized FlaG/YvyC family protein
MSDKVGAVTAVVPASLPGRGNAFAQPNSGGPGNSAKTSSPQDVKFRDPKLQADLAQTQALTKAQSASPAQTQPSAQSQAAAIAAEEAQKARAQEQSLAQSDQNRNLQDAANALGDYFGAVHPDVNFRVDQQASGMVVLMIDSNSGKVLQVIPGEEARHLAQSLFGSASLLPKKA